MSFTICENWQVLHTVGFALTSLVCFSVLLSLRVCVWVSECIPNWFVYVFWLLFRLRGDYSVREELGDFFTRKGSWREFEFALYSAVVFFLLREGTRLLYREVPGGVAHCWRDDDFGMNHCFKCGFFVCVGECLWMLPRRRGFLPRRKSVCLCVFFSV